MRKLTLPVLFFTFITGLHSLARAEEAKPIRQAKMHAVIYKSTFVEKGETYDWKKEPVCDKQVAVNVYDYRAGDSSSYGEPNFIKCTSTVNGAPVEIRASAIAGLSRGPIADYPVEGDVKVFGAYLNLIEPGSPIPANTPNNLDNLFLSKDLSLKSAIFLLAPSNYVVSCHSDTTLPDGHHTGSAGCSTTMPEFFSAFVEITDDQQ